MNDAWKGWSSARQAGKCLKKLSVARYYDYCYYLSFYYCSDLLVQMFLNLVNYTEADVLLAKTKNFKCH